MTCCVLLITRVVQGQGFDCFAVTLTGQHGVCRVCCGAEGGPWLRDQSTLLCAVLTGEGGGANDRVMHVWSIGCI
jgi:hypothetical protein